MPGGYLHPAVYAPILARDEDLMFLSERGYALIDLVVCNVHSFQETAVRPNITLEEAVEQIDIGGMTLLRIAAKNFARVTVIVDPADYPGVLNQIRTMGKVDGCTRQRLAVKAFDMIRDYDTAIHAYLVKVTDFEPQTDVPELPEVVSLGVKCVRTLRYGENPHQMAGLYTASGEDAPLGGTALSGKELSYNNLLDLDVAWKTAVGFEAPTVVFVKDRTPLGIASASSPVDALSLALAADPVSASGGVIAVNRPVTEVFYGALNSLFIEAVAAPDFSGEAQALFAEKRRNCRLLRIPLRRDIALEFRSVTGGLLIQQSDMGDPPGTTWRVVTKRRPSADELQALRFAWKVVQFVPSSAIVIGTGSVTVGIGGGLPNQLDALRIAVIKAGVRCRGAVLASDAFFPFADVVEEAARIGIRCIVQPGGSIRDQEVIGIADENDMSMVFTGVRHLRH